MGLWGTVKVSRSTMAALSIVGLLWGGFSAMVPAIKAGVGASDAQFGLALLMSAVGGIFAMYTAPRLALFLGRNALVVFGSILVLAFFFPLLAHSVPGLALALLAMGASVAALDIVANVQIGATENRLGVHLMNLNHAMFSFAFAAAAFASALARNAGFGPNEILPAIALVAAVLTAVMYQRHAPEAEVTSSEPVSSDRPWRIILLVAVILFCAFLGENTAEVWSALHIERTLGGASGEGGFGPAMLGLTMGLGRLSGQMVSKRLGAARLVLWSAIVGSFGALVIAAAPTIAVAVLGVAFLGVGMAVIVPSANSVLAQLVTPQMLAFSLSRSWMIGFVGFFIGPAMMGAVSQVFGLRFSFVVAAAIVALIVPAIVMLQRKG